MATSSEGHLDAEPAGLLDTNVFLHAQTTDSHSEACRRFLTALAAGRVHAHLEPLVLLELSYALKHYLRQLTRDDVARYLLTVLSWEGVVGDKDLMIDTVERWRTTPGLAFVDAHLAALAARHGCPVYSMNVDELAAQGAVVPRPLPS